MSGEKVTLEELAAIYMAGGRNQKEKSNALPSEKCSNPSDTVAFPAERARKQERRKGRK